MWNLQLPLLAATLVSVFFAQTVLAEEISRSQNLTDNQENPSLHQINLTATHANRKITQLSELEPVFTSARMLLVQSPTPPSEVVQVTAVKANPTDKGVEVILQTSKGQQLQLVNRSSGNNFISDIPNAQLRLPSGDAFTFRSDKPIAGVSEITVTNFDANTIRVRVTGEVNQPVVELFDSPDEGIIFSVASALSATPSQQLPQTQQPQASQPPTQTQPTQPSASGDEPIELVVTGEQDGYNVPDSSTATRTDTPLRDIPQSIQVIPQQVIKDQQITRISDATRNVSGVSPLSGYGGFSDDYTIRGFTNSNLLRNGFTTSNFFTYGANVERVEVLKGPSSVLYGQVEPGGVINFVTKQPLGSPYYAADLTVGSFSFYRGAIDLSGPLTDDKKLLYRLNVAYENSGSFRDFYHQEIFSVSPVITYKPSENTTLNFEYEYGRRRGTFDRGLPPGPVFLTLPISRFLGEPDSFLSIDYQQGTATVDHRFSENLQLRSSLSVQSSFDNNVYTQADGDLEADGRTAPRSNIVNRNRRNEDYSWQTDLIGKFNTGSIAHQLLLGFELRRNTDINPNFFGGDIAPIDIFNPVYGARPTGPVVLRVFGTRISTTGVYLQDQVTLLSNLKLLVGGRYDFVFSDNSAKIGDADTTNSNFYDSAFSPRVGLVYQPIEPISLYASYSSSFVPNNSRTANGISLEPSRGTQYEVGIKSEFFDRRLSATLASYNITKTNIPTTDPNNTDFSIAVGEVKSRGIELDVAGEILPGWKIIASGYLNDAFVSKDNTIPVGRRLENTAYHGASLWTTYEIQKGSLKGLQFGGGIFFVGDRIANQSDPFTVPSSLRTDAAISYKHDNWRAALNFKNIFDLKYYDTQGYYLVPQAPLTVLGTISIEF
ncbi:TonB-dependent siderophore receptor [Nostoc sp. TCL240-02]|uniref:TonB-dependent siderophore receptor n=1 Tax=Nostoc sp. TCL240-02 TaxID=2572090 RepID=UPI0020C603A7|nr:TonB-dependent siderophore receptor [Nostoc sp. TCL240-02]